MPEEKATPRPVFREFATDDEADTFVRRFECFSKMWPGLVDSPVYREGATVYLKSHSAISRDQAKAVHLLCAQAEIDGREYQHEQYKARITEILNKYCNENG